MPAETCPSSDELRRYARGEIDDAAARRLLCHIERCTRCRTVLIALRSGGETVLGPADPLLGETQTVPAALPTVPVHDWPAVPGYTILGELGRGGMGIVYKARQVEAGRLVALKMILAGMHAAPAELARFHAEAEAIARLQHPNIVQVFEVGRHAGLPFFSLEFCAGGSLRRRLDETPLPPRQAAALVEQLARAMHAAHQKRIVHRDLKPANVLLGEDGSPKVTDFGVAKRLGDAGLTLTGTIVGTPSYMAPEQARGRGEAIGPACDTYALGAILYECLTGRPPFRAATALETLRQVCNREPVPPRSLNPPVSRDLDTVCLKCLRKEPERRYASAFELAEDLRRWLIGEPIRARAVGRLERSVKWALRRPASAALATVSAVAATTLLAGAAWFTEGLRDERDEAEHARGEAAARADEAEAGRRLLRRHLYATQIKLASTAWQDANVGRVRELLDAQRPGPGEEDLRGFEWHYLSRLLAADLIPGRGRDRPACCMVFAPAGRRLASFDWDGTVNLWDDSRGPESMDLVCADFITMSVAFGAGGTRLVVATDGGMKMYNSATGAPVRCFRGHAGRVRGVACAGRRLASASQDRTVKVWDASSGQLLHTITGHESGVAAVAFNPDGRLLASASDDRTVRVWDATSAAESLRLRHRDPVAAVAFSPGGDRLAAAGGVYGVCGELRVWDPQAGRELFCRTDFPTEVSTVAFSPDGARLAYAVGNEVKILDAATGQELLSLCGHPAAVKSVAFAPDGLRLASASQHPVVKVWDLRTGADLLDLAGHTGWVYSVAFSSDGRRLASAGDGWRIKLWDASPSTTP